MGGWCVEKLAQVVCGVDGDRTVFELGQIVRAIDISMVSFESWHMSNES